MGFLKLAAFADVKIIGGYGRVISDPETYRVAHQIKNLQCAEVLRLDLARARGSL